MCVLSDSWNPAVIRALLPACLNLRKMLFQGGLIDELSVIESSECKLNISISPVIEIYIHSKKYFTGITDDAS